MCVERKDFLYDTSLLVQSGDRYYDGYWQHEEYFKDAEETIRKAFSFSELISARNKEIVARLRTDNSVALHIRRR